MKRFKRHWHWYQDFPKFHGFWPKNQNNMTASDWGYIVYLWAFWEVHVPQR